MVPYAPLERIKIPIHILVNLAWLLAASAQVHLPTVWDACQVAILNISIIVSATVHAQLLHLLQASTVLLAIKLLHFALLAVVLQPLVLLVLVANFYIQAHA